MERLRKIKNAALLVDILLIIGAVIAILGLATFIHFRGENHTNSTQKASALAVNSQHLDQLENADTPAPKTPTPTSDNSRVKSAETTTPSRMCGSACVTQPLSPPQIAPVVLPRPTCDELKKIQLLDDYNRKLSTENSRYNTDLKSKRGLFGAIDAALSKALSLLHQQTLTKLLAILKNDLAKVYCSS